jgi:hypothetical protein
MTVPSACSGPSTALSQHELYVRQFLCSGRPRYIPISIRRSIIRRGKHRLAKDKIYIEPRAEGGFGAKHEGGKRAVITGETQREVIQETKAKYPSAVVHVARVREVGPGPNKFRKV